jgi:hypothetical protein
VVLLYCVMVVCCAGERQNSQYGCFDFDRSRLTCNSSQEGLSFCMPGNFAFNSSVRLLNKCEADDTELSSCVLDYSPESCRKGCVKLGSIRESVALCRIYIFRCSLIYCAEFLSLKSNEAT